MNIGISVRVGGMFLLGLCTSFRVHAWGDEGHEIVGRIAEHYLDPVVKSRVDTLLAGDTTKLVTPIDIAHEATWADKYRDSDRNTTKVHYNETNQWHYVDIELDGSADFDKACYGHPALPASALASAGAALDCISDKIDEFSVELANPSTPANERLEALEFLLHFLGDTHQPLHASDDHDRGGNSKTVSAPHMAKSNLHSYWDTPFVQALGSDYATVASNLIAQITPAQQQTWSSGTPKDWALESFALAKSEAYGKLPAANSDGSYTLDQAYVDNAKTIVSQQLSKAGVRLAMVLNKALAGTGPGPTPPNSGSLSSVPLDQLIAGAKPIANSYTGKPFIGRLSGGQILTQSKLAVDTDGSVYCKQDPDGQPGTSLETADKQALDARVIPYLVLPAASSSVFAGVKLGDLAVVRYGDKTVYAVLGSTGPKSQYGEASLAVFSGLGEDRVDPNKPHGGYSSKACKKVLSDGKEGKLSRRGLGTKKVPVTIVIFPGSGSAVDRSSAEALKASIDKLGAAHWTGSTG